MKVWPHPSADIPQKRNFIKHKRVTTFEKDSEFKNGMLCVDEFKLATPYRGRN